MARGQRVLVMGSSGFHVASSPCPGSWQGPRRCRSSVAGRSHSAWQRSSCLPSSSGAQTFRPFPLPSPSAAAPSPPGRPWPARQCTCTSTPDKHAGSARLSDPCAPHGTAITAPILKRCALVELRSLCAAGSTPAQSVAGDRRTHAPMGPLPPRSGTPRLSPMTTAKPLGSRSSRLPGLLSTVSTFLRNWENRLAISGSDSCRQGRRRVAGDQHSLKAYAEAPLGPRTSGIRSDAPSTS